MSQNLHFYTQNIINPDLSIKLGFQNVFEMIKVGLKDRDLEDDEELLSLCFTYLQDLNDSLPSISAYEPEITKLLQGTSLLLFDNYYLVNEELWKNIKIAILLKTSKNSSEKEMKNLITSELNNPIDVLESYQEQNILVVGVS